MESVVILGVVATVVALLGLLGRVPTGTTRMSQIVVFALPLGIIAGGYAAGIGMDLKWGVVAAISVVLAVLAGGLLGRQPDTADTVSRPAAAGLNLACSGLISLGLAAVAIRWAGSLIDSFSYLNDPVVIFVLTLTSVAFAIGGRTAVGLSRTVLVLIVIGAVAVLGIGFLAGDASGLGAPLVPVPQVPAGEAILYAVGVVLIGAGYPVLRGLGSDTRGRSVVAAVVLGLVVLVTLVGIMVIYGGAFQLPSLVINVFPVYTPSLLAAVVCGLMAVIAAVTAGAAIHAAGANVATLYPRWYDDAEHRPSARRRVTLVMGLAVLLLAWLAPPPAATVFVLSVLGVANLVAEWVVRRGRSGSAAAGVQAQEAGGAQTREAGA